MPPGPIPMPYTSDAVDSQPAPEVYTIPVKIIETPEPPKPEEPKPEPKELSAAENKLQKIQSEIAEILQRVEKFTGGKRDKEYLFLDDLLTQKLCLLDSIDSDGREDIRMMRKDSIKTVNRCLSILDKRATSSTPAKNGAKNDAENDAENCEGNAAQVSNQVLSDLAAQSQKEDEGPKNNNKNDEAK
jgi:NTP pyrophosphatase (non-canonical NTP hydrolase)